MYPCQGASHRMFPASSLLRCFSSLLSLWHHRAIQMPRWDSWELSWILLLCTSPITQSGQFHLQSHPQKCLLSTVSVSYHLDHDFRHLIIPLTNIYLLVTYCSHLLCVWRWTEEKEARERERRVGEFLGRGVTWLPGSERDPGCYIEGSLEGEKQEQENGEGSNAVFLTRGDIGLYQPEC